jgi:tripartite ATP-independent transporter DctM subunit
MTFLVFISSWMLMIFIGIPIAVAMFVASIGYFLYTGIGINFAAQRVVDGLNSFPIIAVPLFILAASIFNSSSITKNLFGFATALVGHIRGGLGHVNILASLFFSGMSGSAVADAGGLGKIEAEAMQKAGYPHDLAAALTAVSSILGPLVPPSIPMVVYGVVSGASIGGLFLGGIVPGVLCTLAMMVMLYVVAGRVKLPVHARATGAQIRASFIRSFPALLTPVVIIGGIFSGIFSPTEAAAVTVLYAIFIDLVFYRELTWRKLWDAIYETAVMSSTIALIIGGVSMMGIVMAREKAPEQIAGLLMSVASTPTEFMFAVCAMLLILGCFIEVLALLLVLVPSFIPLALALNIDPVYFGVVIIFTLMIGTLTPPMGMILFVVSKSHGVEMHRLIRATMPWLIPLVLVLLAMILYPPIVTALPNFFMS